MPHGDNPVVRLSVYGYVYDIRRYLKEPREGCTLEKNSPKNQTSGGNLRSAHFCIAHAETTDGSFRLFTHPLGRCRDPNLAERCFYRVHVLFFRCFILL